MKDISQLTKDFYVITPIFNPFRYQSRYKLYHEFRQRVECSGANLVTVECAFAQRPFEVEDAPIKFRSPYELWLKENLVNLAIARLPHDWRWVAWVDADIAFTRPDWVEETVHLLQHYHFVQMFSEIGYLSPTYGLLSRSSSFVEMVRLGFDPGGYYYYGSGASARYGAPGFAWAAGREAIDRVGGLIDFSILGSADYHMARALIGKAELSMPRGMRGRYYERIMEWQERALTLIKKNVGVMPGLILHYWHGRLQDRRYKDRWRILQEAGFDPDRDLKKDSQGVLQLVNDGSERLIQLRDDIRAYFLGRNEDSIDV